MPGKPKTKPRAKLTVHKDPGGYYVYDRDQRVMGPYEGEAQAYAASELGPVPAGKTFEMDPQPLPERVGEIDRVLRNDMAPPVPPSKPTRPLDQPIEPIAGTVGGAYARAGKDDKERRRAAVAAALRGR